MKKNYSLWLVLSLSILTLGGCREDDTIISEEVENLPPETVPSVA